MGNIFKLKKTSNNSQITVKLSNIHLFNTIKNNKTINKKVLNLFVKLFK